jgi:hypothetical protein
LKKALLHPISLFLGGSVVLGLNVPTSFFGGMIAARIYLAKKYIKSRRLLKIAAARDKRFLT